MQRAKRVDAAKLHARQEVDAALPNIVKDLEGLSKGVSDKAQGAARLEVVESLIGQITSQSDAEQLSATFAAFEGEPFFTPYAAVGPHAYFLGEQLLYTSDAKLTDMLAPLARSATISGSAQSFQAWGGAVWAIGVGRSSKVNPQQQPILFALGERLTPALLESLATGNQVAVMLVPEGKTGDAVAAGSTEGQTTLKRWSTAMKLDVFDACCTRKVLTTGVELLVYKDPQAIISGAEAEASSSTPLFFGVAGVIALIGLVFGFRPAPKDDGASTELLRITADQLKQSQEQLQRLSLQLSVKAEGEADTQPRRAAPVDDGGLGSTQAAVQTSRYEIVAPLGEGGMARVSVAVVRGAEGFRRTFVLKRLRPELIANQEAVNQFIDEARLGASLVHSNIVPVFDFGRDSEGYFMAQEYILGRDVDALIEASKAQRARPLELPYVLLIGQEGLKALSYAHTKKNDSGKPMGLVHRDVSPNNLMVSARGEVKLLDFGIVKSDDRVTRTQAGTVKGNLFFMSPEQARAIPVDPRSDVFSMGMVLFSAITGNPLYSGNNVYELMTRAAVGLTDEDRARVRAEAGALAPVLLQALSLDPAGRFPDADAFAAALAGLGRPATTAELQGLMEGLFTQAFAEERQKFAVTS